VSRLNANQNEINPGGQGNKIANENKQKLQAVVVQQPLDFHRKKGTQTPYPAATDID